jgi:trafficking protein particle complex subunit 4
MSNTPRRSNLTLTVPNVLSSSAALAFPYPCTDTALSVHAITARLNPLKGHQPPPPSGSRPEPPSGLEMLETENFRMQCFSTQTGIKFLLFTDTLQTGVNDATMRRVYELYADYVMKNPFYQLEMPVRCDMFDRKLNSYIREINNAR